MEKPLVSVVVPCFNSERFLSNTLESLRQQDFAGWECILVDDGSTDSTFEIASRFAARDPRFRIIRQANAGRALALRAGCEQARDGSEHLFFLDSDDLLEPGALRVLSAYLDAHPEASVAACWSQLIDAHGNLLEGLARSRWVPGRLWPRLLQRHEVITPFAAFYCGTGQGPFAMHRRSAFQKTSGLDPRFSEFSLHEDTDLFCQMALQGEVHYLPEQLYRSRRHGSNVSKGNDRVQLAYIRFRSKWDAFVAPTRQQQAVVEAARRFYFGTFRPCRNLKVAAKALREFAGSLDVRALRWAAHLLKEAAHDFVVFGMLARPVVHSGGAGQD